MTRSRLRTSLLTACLTLSAMLAMPAFAQTVKVDYDRDVDFSTFKTYAWQEGRSGANPLVDKRIVQAIDAQLSAKGWTRVESSPNALVTYRAAINGRRQLNAWGHGPRWSGMGTITEEMIYTGQIVVDISEAASERLIWRGLATDAVSDKADKNEKRLNEAIAKLFKQFPPSAGPRSTSR